MISKLLAAAAAAAVVTVPLAPAAWADKGGIPGAIGGTPGGTYSGVAKSGTKTGFVTAKIGDLVNTTGQAPAYGLKPATSGAGQGNGPKPSIPSPDSPPAP